MAAAAVHNLCVLGCQCSAIIRLLFQTQPQGVTACLVLCGNVHGASANSPPAFQGDWTFALRAKGLPATLPDSEPGALRLTDVAIGERMFGSASERGCRMARGAGSCRRMDPGLLVLGSYTPVGSCIHWHHTHCDGLFWTHRARAIQGSCIDMLCAPPSWFLGVGPGTLPAMPACSG